LYLTPYYTPELYPTFFACPQARQWRTSLSFGALPAGVPMVKTFHVFNTGGLGGWVGVCMCVPCSTPSTSLTPACMCEIGSQPTRATLNMLTKGGLGGCAAQDALCVPQGRVDW